MGADGPLGDKVFALNFLSGWGIVDKVCCGVGPNNEPNWWRIYIKLRAGLIQAQNNMPVTVNVPESNNEDILYNTIQGGSGSIGGTTVHLGGKWEYGELTFSIPTANCSIENLPAGNMMSNYGNNPGGGGIAIFDSMAVLRTGLIGIPGQLWEGVIPPSLPPGPPTQSGAAVAAMPAVPVCWDIVHKKAFYPLATMGWRAEYNQNTTGAYHNSSPSYEAVLSNEGSPWAPWNLGEPGPCDVGDLDDFSDTGGWNWGATGPSLGPHPSLGNPLLAFNGQSLDTPLTRPIPPPIDLPSKQGGWVMEPYVIVHGAGSCQQNLMFGNNTKQNYLI